MAQKKRMYQIAERIKELLATQLLRATDPRLQLVTITAVVTSQDLGHAKVYWITSGDKERIEQTREGFESAKNHLRRSIGHALGIRYTPELVFYYDDTLDETAKIEDIFRKLEEDKKTRGL